MQLTHASMKLILSDLKVIPRKRFMVAYKKPSIPHSIKHLNVIVNANDRNAHQSEVRLIVFQTESVQT